MEGFQFSVTSLPQPTYFKHIDFCFVINIAAVVFGRIFFGDKVCIKDCFTWVESENYKQLDQLDLNMHDKFSRSPGPSCTFWAPESTHFAWNSYTAVYSSLCTLYTCSAPDQLFVLYSWFSQNRFASEEVSLTILKTENRQTDSQIHSGGYRVRSRTKKHLTLSFVSLIPVDTSGKLMGPGERGLP